MRRLIDKLLAENATGNHSNLADFLELAAAKLVSNPAAVDKILEGESAITELFEPAPKVAKSDANA